MPPLRMRSQTPPLLPGWEQGTVDHPAPTPQFYIHKWHNPLLRDWPEIHECMVLSFHQGYYHSTPAQRDAPPAMYDEELVARVEAKLDDHPLNAWAVWSQAEIQRLRKVFFSFGIETRKDQIARGEEPEPPIDEAGLEWDDGPTDYFDDDSDEDEEVVIVQEEEGGSEGEGEADCGEEGMEGEDDEDDEDQKVVGEGENDEGEEEAGHEAEGKAEDEGKREEEVDDDDHVQCDHTMPTSLMDTSLSGEDMGSSAPKWRQLQLAADAIPAGLTRQPSNIAVHFNQCQVTELANTWRQRCALQTPVR